MNIKDPQSDIQSDFYMVKLNSNEVIESCELFSSKFYDLRFKTIDKELTDLKCDVNKCSDRLNKEIRRLEDKIDKESLYIKAMVDVKYNKIENRLYQIVYGAIAIIFVENIVKRIFL